MAECNDIKHRGTRDSVYFGMLDLQLDHEFIKVLVGYSYPFDPVWHLVVECLH